MWWVDPAALDTPKLRETLRALSERRRVKGEDDDRTSEFLDFLRCSLRRHNVTRVLTPPSTASPCSSDGHGLFV